MPLGSQICVEDFDDFWASRAPVLDQNLVPEGVPDAVGFGLGPGGGFGTISGPFRTDFYDDFFSNKEQSSNKKLCEVRSAFDNYNLISGLHTFYSQENKIYENILPPLRLLSESEKKNLMNMLKDLNFNIKSLMAA